MKTNSPVLQINSSHGEFFADPATGLVTQERLDQCGDGCPIGIKRFNVTDYLQWSGRSLENLKNEYIDILDIGYWTVTGSYEPPSVHHRYQVRNRKTPETMLPDDEEAERITHSEDKLRAYAYMWAHIVYEIVCIYERADDIPSIDLKGDFESVALHILGDMRSASFEWEYDPQAYGRNGRESAVEYSGIELTYGQRLVGAIRTRRRAEAFRQVDDGGSAEVKFYEVLDAPELIRRVRVVFSGRRATGFNNFTGDEDLDLVSTFDMPAVHAKQLVAGLNLRLED